MFGLAALLRFELLPRIRNWHDLNFYRPDPAARYSHLDSLFGDTAIDWGLIERHWTDLLRTAISIREGRVSSVTLLRRLGNHSHKNRLYRAFRELGRVIRTVTLLRYLSEPVLREQITAVTNKAEAFHGYSQWLTIGGRLIGHNDPDHQERVIKFNELLANCAIYSTALGITDVANGLAVEGYPVDTDDLATILPVHPAHHPPYGRSRARPRAAGPDTRDSAGLGAAGAARAADLSGYRTRTPMPRIDLRRRWRPSLTALTAPAERIDGNGMRFACRCRLLPEDPDVAVPRTRALEGADAVGEGRIRLPRQYVSLPLSSCSRHRIAAFEHTGSGGP
ncbi:Tn3 family transposase [Rhodococcus erythropolis]|uniref:Tn3 family transposase n=1 Tax=Rhodococcus erythropolis TaxID=1833 RepID=UPI002949E7A5|nr:Tn3 family transposase [Rhodococcus erythropolis]MDV6277715.1 Tn3 family transposase [Rhodococcus erythropolis]